MRPGPYLRSGGGGKIMQHGNMNRALGPGGWERAAFVWAAKMVLVTAFIQCEAQIAPFHGRSDSSWEQRSVSESIVCIFEDHGSANGW